MDPRIPRAPESLPGARGPLLFSIVSLILFLTPAPISSAPKVPESLPSSPPNVMREFRGAWIASYANIDWPSKPGLSAAEQKSELLTLMDKAVDLRLNALLLQVRAACDAIYPSSIEPWSIFLTGEMGKAPEPLYDPLKFAIEEAHKRGLELHAWFNPYRAGVRNWTNISSRHISKTHPNLVRRYGKFLWLDPSERAVQDYTSKVILDVVRRYDIDGVHMDDYFYPYPEKGRNGELMEFPDDASWKKYTSTGGSLNRGDWRRDNVNKLIRRLSREIKAEKGWVTFGVSPFGIWRPGFPQQIRGFDAYDKLYADARHWILNNWVDYIAPQLYWPIDPPEQSYSALFDWWGSQNKQMPVWPGGAVTRVGKWPANEIVRQIELTRQSAVPGYIHWNLSSLAANPDKLREKLIGKVYKEPALPPSNRGSSFAPPLKPAISLERKGSENPMINWSAPTQNSASAVACWLFQTKIGDKWESEVLPRKITSRTFRAKEGGTPHIIAVSAIDRFRNVSPCAMITP
jgi:uncharacterized lipoprotein YddW (UPF0748 family)